MMAIKDSRVCFFSRLRDLCADSPDTLIVWTEPSGTDMALSFQEAEGCASIWCVAAFTLGRVRADFCRNFVISVRGPCFTMGTLSAQAHFSLTIDRRRLV